MRAVNFLVAFSLFMAISCRDSGRAEIKDDTLRSSTSANSKLLSSYRIIDALNANGEITNERPSKKDTTIRLCIACAFTRLDNGGIDGLYILNGKIINSTVNKHLGGGLLIDHGKLSIIKTYDAKLLTEEWIDSVAARGASFLQQIQLVRDSVKLDFHRDVKFFQRRAIALFSTGRTAVIESNYPIQLEMFAEDLIKMGVVNALYTDMGDWDEGWYRRPGTTEITTIGTLLSSTEKQSNWFIFSR